MFQITPPHHIRQLQENGIPVVLCNRAIENVSAPLVTWDFEEIGRLAARHFLKHGHEIIGYYANLRCPMTEANLRGMEEVLIAAEYAINPDNIVFLDSLSLDDKDKQKILKKWLGRPDRPMAILCNDDTEAENLFWVATDIGLKVPEDLAIIGFGVPEREGFFRGRLTSISINAFELGKKAAELLAEMQDGKRSITDNESFEIELNCVPSITA